MFIRPKSLTLASLSASLYLLSCFGSVTLAQDTQHTHPCKTHQHNMLLSETQINNKIATLPQWNSDGKSLERTLIFPDFVSAIAFVNKIVEPAEAAGHHPDLEISYNKVKITLSTHDAGGLTDLDFDLAQTISNLVASEE